MTGALTTAVLAGIVLCQPLPPEMRKQSQKGYDPVLPTALRGAVERAAQAELDPKRGPGNAVQILKAEQRKYRGDRNAEMALTVRVAATKLRQMFSKNKKVEPAMAYQQALSTFSKLDVTEPGLKEWFALAQSKSPDGKKTLEQSGKKIKVAVLTRGEGLDRKKIFGQLKDAVDGSGLTLVKTNVKGAAYVLKFGAGQLRRPGESPKVRVTLELQSTSKVPWKQTLFRTTEAQDPMDALAAATEWVVRIGGRDLFFHYIGTNGFPSARFEAPKAGGHQH